MYVDSQEPVHISQDSLREGEEYFYPGDIYIDGDLHGGAQVRSLAGIYVSGNVELSTLTAGGDIVVKGTVTGSPKNALTAGRDIRLANAHSLSAKAGRHIEVFSNVEISDFFAGGQITILTGLARDSKLMALQGLWLTLVKCSVPRACELTVGYHYGFYERFTFYQQLQKRLTTEQQGQLNSMAATIRKVSESPLKKKMGWELDGKMSAIYENKYNLDKLAAAMRQYKDWAMQDAQPIIVCEKGMDKGCQIVLQEHSLVLPDYLEGPATLVINKEKKTIGRVPGVHGLQKTRKENAQ